MTRQTWRPLFAALVLAAPSLQAAPAPAQRPYCHLYGVGYAPADLNDDEMRRIAAWFSIVEGEFTPEQIAGIKKHNPDSKIIRYLNSSYTAQYLASMSSASNYMEDEVRNLEDGHKTAISMFLTATLAEGVDLNTAVLRLTPARASLGLRASTIGGNLSRDTDAYVTWLRIGDELMRIESIDEKHNTVRVTRGIDGMRKTAHAGGARVFSPVYIGLGEHAGSGRPGAPKLNKLRYAYEPHAPLFYEVKAKQLIELMRLGYDGSKFDIMGLNFFNQADAFGNKVVPWDFERGAPFNEAAMLAAQQRKVAFVQDFVHRKTGRWPVIVGNGGGEYFGSQGAHAGTMNYLMSTPLKPWPLDGIQLENFVSTPHRDVFGNPGRSVDRVIHAAKHGLPTVSLLTFERLILGSSEARVIQHEKFGYACHLLGWEPGTPAMCSAPVFRDVPGGARQVPALLPFYGYDLGQPTQSFDRVAAYETATKGVYARAFNKELVLVNATDRDMPDLALGREYYDPDAKRMVRTTALRAHTGNILLLTQSSVSQ